MTQYKWVHHEGGKLYSVGILSDGRLHNPNGYDQDIVRSAVLAADARTATARSNSAMKAARTRVKRQERRVLCRRSTPDGRR